MRQLTSVLLGIPFIVVNKCDALCYIGLLGSEFNVYTYIRNAYIYKYVYDVHICKYM